MELGRIASEAEAERKELKKDIEFLLDGGEVLGEDGRYLRYSFETRTGFEWERAFKDGRLTMEDLKTYGTMTVIRKVINAKTDEDGSVRDAQENLLRAHARTLADVIHDMIPIIDPERNDDAAQRLQNVLNAALGYDEGEKMEKIMEKVGSVRTPTQKGEEG
jgi:hypothetical protein